MEQVSINFNPGRLASIRNFRILTAALISVLITFTLFILLVFMAGKFTGQSLQPQPFTEGQYNIVYMANNLFYFCRLSEFNSEYYRCDDAYYLTREKDDSGNERVAVVQPHEKEIYRPDGPFFLNRKNVIYVSEVGSESEVFKAIQQDSGGL